MQPLVANTDDLISLLDRVLDKGIVLDNMGVSLVARIRFDCRQLQSSIRLQNFRRIVRCVRRLRNTRHVAGRRGTGRSISLLAARSLEQIASRAHTRNVADFQKIALLTF